MKAYEHNTGSFIGRGGIEIFFQTWTVERPRAVLIISHGHGEHSSRYSNIINKLEGKHISIYAMDHRGHGRSRGKKGHVMSFLDYIYDLKVFIDHIKEDMGKLPFILLGHSMGGAIALRYALHYPDDLKGLILSSALLYLKEEVPRWKQQLGKKFSTYMPGFTMPSGLNSNDLSHDAYVVDAYENDPLVHDRASSRWYTEMLSNTEECMSRAGELQMPLLIFHGDSDNIVDCRGSEELYALASSKVKEFHLFEGLYHETMNESDEEKEKVLNIVASWIENLVSKKKKTKKTKKKTAAKKTGKKAAGTKKTSSKKKSTAKKSTKKKHAKKTAKKKK